MYSSMFFSGKPSCQKIDAANDTGTFTHSIPRLLRIFYLSASLHFPIDTGAQLSLLPRDSSSHSTPIPGAHSYVDNGTAIATYEERSCSLDLNFCQTFCYRRGFTADFGG